MNSDDKSTTWVIGILLAFLLCLVAFEETFTYLEREHDIQQQRLEIKQRQLAVQDRDLRNQLRIHCLKRTDISSESKAKECWDGLR